jgi:hypothetical protein
VDPSPCSVQGRVPWQVRLALPVIALATCLLFYAGIWAAILASRAVDARWDLTYPQHAGELLARERTRNWGWAPAVVVPLVLIGAWVGALCIEIF